MQNINPFASKTTSIAAISITTLLFTLAPMTAFSARPHFIGTPNCDVTNSGDLECSGKIAGLGNVSEVEASLQADVTCTNRGEHIPQGLTGGEAETLEVSNGQALFDLTLENPCPDGMKATFSNVEVVVDDTTLPISGTF